MRLPYNSGQTRFFVEFPEDSGSNLVGGITFGDFGKLSAANVDSCGLDQAGKDATQ